MTPRAAEPPRSDLLPKQKLVTARHFVLTMGSASHCFIMQQWFVMKFGALGNGGLIMAIHRFTFGVPLVLAALVAAQATAPPQRRARAPGRSGDRLHLVPIPP